MLFLGSLRTSNSRCHGSGLIFFNERCDGETKLEDELLKNTGRLDNDELNRSKQIRNRFPWPI